MNNAYRPRRTCLSVPGSSQKMIDKSKGLPADEVFLDLEDAVAPEAKDQARAQAVAALRSGGFGASEVIVRINALDGEWGEADLDALRGVPLDGVLAPKVSDADGLDAYSARLDGATPLWIMIETARSLFQLENLAARAETGPLAGFVLGTNDLAKETGAIPDVDRMPFLGALGLAVAAARAYGLTILDGVFGDLDDEAGFIQQTEQGVAFGFDGKTLIHPRQITPCNTIFTPSAAQANAARRIIEAFALPENALKGAIRLDGKMVERLHMEQAHRVLAAIGR